LHNITHASNVKVLKDDRQKFFIESEQKAVSNSLLQHKNVWLAQMDE